ncbi:hypothetical protein SDC9_162572 [bioreactor metagenome]|uniref:Uncharacterized protein n=1 Tax=bioreactor metagenome TaxID=1076179 RepID=A0A645FNT4_9ZZZZ
MVYLVVVHIADAHIIKAGHNCQKDEDNCDKMFDGEF